MSEDQIWDWTNSIKKAEVEHDMARGSGQVIAMHKDILSTRDHETARLHAAGAGGAPRGITDMNKKHGFHHHFLNLMIDEAVLVVASWHGIILNA